MVQLFLQTEAIFPESGGGWILDDAIAWGAGFNVHRWTDELVVNNHSILVESERRRYWDVLDSDDAGAGLVELFA